MLDPPRYDSALTLRNLQAAGISVKMITGDHLNIGIETARLIGENCTSYLLFLEFCSLSFFFADVHPEVS